MTQIVRLILTHLNKQFRSNHINRLKQKSSPVYPSHTGVLSKKCAQTNCRLDRLRKSFHPFTSFPAVQWNLQASQSFSPHRSRFNQHTPRDNLNYLIPSLCRHALLHTSSRGEEIWARGEEKWDHKATVCYWGLRSRLTDKRTEIWLQILSESVPHTTFSSQTQQQHNNKLYSTLQRGEDRGKDCLRGNVRDIKKCEGWVEVKGWGAF